MNLDLQETKSAPVDMLPVSSVKGTDHEVIWKAMEATHMTPSSTAIASFHESKVSALH
jgi:hypothetical protein